VETIVSAERIYAAAGGKIADITAQFAPIRAQLDRQRERMLEAAE
jgi:hypothetical protein